MYLAKIYIQLRPTVSDPQGQTIRGGLHQLGFNSVTSVRAGKYMEIALHAESQAAAAEQVRQMCDKLLANPVIEDYRFTSNPISLPLNHIDIPPLLHFSRRTFCRTPTLRA